MAIWITGDTHIPHDIKKLTSNEFPEGKKMSKNDYVIICGDFGLIWNHTEDGEEKYWKKWLNEKPWTTLFIDGNHENAYRLNKLPKKEMFGSNVGVVSNSIFHLKRGEIYTIQNKKFFCFGGAKSIDTMDRIEGVSWWREELPSYTEKEYGLTNLEKHNNKVNYIVSHTLPLNLRNEIQNVTYLGDKWYDDTCKYLQHIYENIEFEKGFCGHWHVDQELKKYTVLYSDVIQIC